MEAETLSERRMCFIPVCIQVAKHIRMLMEPDLIDHEEKGFHNSSMVDVLRIGMYLSPIEDRPSSHHGMLVLQ